MSLGLNLTFSILCMFATSPYAYGASQGDTQAAYLKPTVIVGDLTPKRSKTNGHAAGIKVSYERGCGETFRGILIKEEINVVQVGVVVERSAKLCSALPTKEDLVLPVSTDKAIDVFPESGSGRLILIEATNVSMAQGHIFVSYQNTCKPMAGVLISPVSNHGTMAMGINLVQELSSQSVATSLPACQFETKRIALSAVHAPSQSAQLVSRPGEMKSLYALGLKAPRSLKISGDGSLAITWDKTCKEKAVGALFSGPGGRVVAIVSVYSPNSNCRSLSQTQEVYTVKALSVPSGVKLEATTSESVLLAGQKANFKFNLLPISTLNLTRRGAPFSISAKVLPTCLDNLGVVMGEDSAGNMAAAVMAANHDKVCSIEKLPVTLSLQTPLVGPTVGPMPKVFGLRVLGTMIN